jgi:hypothetical protein
MMLVLIATEALIGHTLGITVEVSQILNPAMT